MRFIWLLLLFASISCFSMCFALPLSLLWIKYIAFAYFVFFFFAMVSAHLSAAKKPIKGSFVASAILLSLYTLLSLDTFLFHARFPISGMLRYAIYDFYLPVSAVFMISGSLYGWGRKSKPW